MENFKMQDSYTGTKFYLVFWYGDHPSFDIEFTDEAECDKILDQIRKGKGVQLKFDYQDHNKFVFPIRVVKLKMIIDHHYSADQLQFIYKNFGIEGLESEKHKSIAKSGSAKIAEGFKESR